MSQLREPLYLAQLYIKIGFGTQAAFCRKYSLDERYVSAILRGRRQLPLKDQRLWAERLGKSREELFGNNASA